MDKGRAYGMVVKGWVCKGDRKGWGGRRGRKEKR